MSIENVNIRSSANLKYYQPIVCDNLCKLEVFHFIIKEANTLKAIVNTSYKALQEHHSRSEYKLKAGQKDI